MKVKNEIKVYAAAAVLSVVLMVSPGAAQGEEPTWPAACSDAEHQLAAAILIEGTETQVSSDDLVRLAAIAQEACYGNSRCLDHQCVLYSSGNQDADAAERRASRTADTVATALLANRICSGAGGSLVDSYVLQIQLEIDDQVYRIQRNLQDQLTQAEWQDVEGTNQGDRGLARGLNGAIEVTDESIPGSAEVAYGGLVIAGADGLVNGECSTIPFFSLAGDSASLEAHGIMRLPAGYIKLSGLATVCTGLCL